ncbi:MAG: GHKL domain-containing protein [Eisenbergiella massiliensis]
MELTICLTMPEVRLRKKCVELKLETEIMESPIKEYDFFAVLGNLLDNAIDAAAKCDEGRRSVELKLYRANNITVLSLKNSYSSEPKKKEREIFIS